MTTHRLKTTPEYFAAVWSGAKPYEIRWDDRAYQPGDTVVLLEWDPRITCRCVGPDCTHAETCDRYSGRWIEATVGHVASSTPPRGRQPGFRGNGYVVFALLDLETSEDLPVDEPPVKDLGIARRLVEAMTPPTRSRAAQVDCSVEDLAGEVPTVTVHTRDGVSTTLPAGPPAPSPADLARRRQGCDVVPQMPRLAYTSESGRS